MSKPNMKFQILEGQSFLALVYHLNLRLSVSTGFQMGHHRGLSYERPMILKLTVSKFNMYDCKRGVWHSVEVLPQWFEIFFYGSSSIDSWNKYLSKHFHGTLPYSDFSFTEVYLVWGRTSKGHGRTSTKKTLNYVLCWKRFHGSSVFQSAEAFP